jgi:signal transduction histidine kinase
MGSTVTRSSRASRADPDQSESNGAEAHPGRSSLLNTLAGIAGERIAESAIRITDSLPQDIHLHSDELERHLLWIAGACTGEAPEHLGNGATMTLRRRLIDVIREDLLAHWALQPDAPDMLKTMQQLERGQKACAPAADQSFVAALTDRGGLDLVVEVAHDMRSPLTSILFLSEILHRGQTSGGFNEVQKRQIGIIYSAALGLVGLASDMIEIAKGGSQLRAPEPVPFSVNEVLRGVHDLVRPMAEEKKLDVNMQMLESEHRLGFPIPLSRILLNLTTNALKFTHAGGVHLVAESGGGSLVHFSVRDTGPGIRAEAMATLYEPFRREPMRESGYSFSGTGLGLAICRKLVTALGSELNVETDPGQGTCFSFEIELAPASAMQTSPRLM